MQSAEQAFILELGGARLELTPPLPPLWQTLAQAAPGPASLCLALLPLANPRWQGVLGPGGQPAMPEPPALAALPAGLWPRLLPGLCPPWLSPPEEQELEALEGFLRARADFPGLDCAACREQERRGEGAPDCAGCPRPWPPPAARTALALRPLLAVADGPGLAQAWLAGLAPRQQWLLAWRLALIERWLGPPAGGHCPLSGGHGKV